MGEAPDQHNEKPDAVRRREFRRAAPVLTVIVAGLAIGGVLKDGHDSQRNTVHINTAAEAKRALCSPESDWRNMPDTTDWKFLASLLKVGVERAKTAQIALVKCNEVIPAGHVLNTQIDVDGQDGPCLPLDLMPAPDNKNPFTRHKEIIAVCAGQPATAPSQEIS